MDIRNSQYLAHRLTGDLRSLLSVGTAPIVVALDGPSGSGKSTIATIVADTLNAESMAGGAVVTVIEGDQFYRGGSATTWDKWSVGEKMNHVMDWRCQRTLLKSLLDTGVGIWRSFDWDSEDWDTDMIPLKPEPNCCVATPMVLLEGVYSARPQLADLVDLRVLVKIPDAVRHDQLRQREGGAYGSDWDSRWAEIEDYYFAEVMPEEAYDLILALPAEG
ncbi:uridine kinase family protein [Exilibacterium tricleocarpae]|nr:(d)CMP kinase [Exilibacterium tricleocarpae]